MAVALVSNGRNPYYNQENYRPQARIIRTLRQNDDEEPDYSNEIAKRRAEVAAYAPRRQAGSVPKAGKAPRASAKSTKVAQSQTKAARNTAVVSSEWLEVQFAAPVKKRPVSIRLDEDVLEFFKKDGRGYQRRVSAVLRQFFLFQTGGVAA